jgi:hypothetical protein
MSDLDKLRADIQTAGTSYSPLITPNLGELTGKTYKELFESMMSLLSKYYGQKSDRFIGFKEVWTDEFIMPLARTFPEAKFIQITRDPRAVLASKKARSSRYPWLFLARQWRKLAAFTWIYQQQDGDFNNRVLPIKYEDLICKPEQTAKNICRFLELDFDEKMIDPCCFVDGKGEKWLQNTSFGKGKQEFDTNAIDRWEISLTDYEISYIEALCGPEMRLLGYELQKVVDRISPGLILSPPRVINEELANWIKKHIQNDPVYLSLQTAKEQIRYELLNLKDTGSVDKQLIEACFLFYKLYGKLAG